MKKIFLLILGLIISSTSWAGFNNEIFYKAYREYKDRSSILLPLVNEKIVIDKVVDIGKNNQGGSIYTVYLEVKLGLSKHYDAVQVTVDKNGNIDSFNGIFSISATMIRDQHGNDIRFPLGLNEVQFAKLAQTAFDLAKSEYVKTYLDSDNVGTFYVSSESSNEVKKNLTINVMSHGLPGNKSTSRMTQVSVYISSETGKVIKSYNRDY